jgi:protein disulfide-isomerase A1
VTKSFDDVTFAHTFSSDVASHFEAAAESVVLFRKFDSPKVVFSGEFTVAELKAFIETNETPVVMGFDQKSAGKIFGENHPALFVLTSESEESKAAEAALHEVSSQLHGKILMSKTPVNDGLGKRLGDYIGVTEADVPCVRIINPTKDGAVLKYEFQGAISAESLLRFYNDFSAGKLSPAYKSEPVPESQDGPVHVLVGKSFADVVMDSSKDVLVEFYAPWCGHCKSLAPIYDEVAAKLANNPNIIVAKMDATANEAEGVNVQGFPTIKFYPATDKTPVDYTGDRTVEGFLKFLKEKGTVAWVEDEAAVPEKEDL